MKSEGKTYQEILENSPLFENPRLEDLLAQEVGLNPFKFYTNMSGSRGRYPSNEYAQDLRGAQASKWAFR